MGLLATACFFMILAYILAGIAYYSMVKSDFSLVTIVCWILALLPFAIAIVLYVMHMKGE